MELAGKVGRATCVEPVLVLANGRLQVWQYFFPCCLLLAHQLPVWVGRPQLRRAQINLQGADAQAGAGFASGALGCEAGGKRPFTINDQREWPWSNAGLHHGNDRASGIAQINDLIKAVQQGNGRWLLQPALHARCQELS